MAQTALATDPTTGATNDSPNIERMQRRVDYLKRVRPNDPQIKTLTAQIRKAQKQASSVNNPPPSQPSNELPPVTPVSPDPYGQDLYKQFSEQASQFDPRNYQNQYSTQFSDEMEKARQNIMGTFERRNAEEFARQKEDVERTILERGLDPTAPAAEALRKQLTTRQDLARQEAMSAAESQAYNVQQQGFQQGQETALLPGNIWQQFKDPYLNQREFEYQQNLGQRQFQYQQNLGRQEFEYQRQLREMENRQRKWELRNQPRGGGGGGGGGAPQQSPFDRYMEQEFLNRYAQGQPPPRPDLASDIARGIAAGVGQQVGSSLAR